MCNSVIFASLFYLMILVAFLHIFQLSPFPLVIVVLYVVCLCLKSIMYNKIYVSLWPCFEAKILLVYVVTSFLLPCALLYIFLVCACFFMGICLCDVIHLETYTHMRR